VGIFIFANIQKNTFKKFFISKRCCMFAFQKYKIMATATKVQVEFDIFKTLHVIENDKVINEIFRDGDSKLSYRILCSMAKQGALKASMVENIEEVFDSLIVKNPTLLKKYTKLSDEDIDNGDAKLPKHYGKQQILKDIEENGSKTELDRAMLALNDLRNIYAKLKARGIKDKKLGTKNLNRDACRDIIATVRIVENKLSNILNKK